MQFLGGRVNLVVNTLTVGGAPTDTHADRSAVQEWTRLLARRNQLAFCRTPVRVGCGVQRVKHQLTGFKLLELGAALSGSSSTRSSTTNWLAARSSSTGGR